MEEAFNRCGTYDSNARKRRQLDSYTAELSEDAFGRSIERNQAVRNMHFFEDIINYICGFIKTSTHLKFAKFAIVFLFLRFYDNLMSSLSCLSPVSCLL